MSHKQMGKLIIENIQILEEAERLLSGDLSQEIYDELEKVLHDKEKMITGEWSQSNELFSNTFYLFALRIWGLIHSEDFRVKDYFACYFLTWKSINPEQEVEQHLVTILFKNSFNVMVFKFFTWFGCYANCTNSMWKKFSTV